MCQRLKFWLSLWSLLLKAVAAQAKKHCLLPGKKGDPSTEGKEGDGGGVHQHQLDASHISACGHVKHTLGSPNHGWGRVSLVYM